MIANTCSVRPVSVTTAQLIFMNVYHVVQYIELDAAELQLILYVLKYYDISS